MDDLKERLDRELRGLPISPDGLEKTLARARRHQRNQRLAAGIVAVALFAGASLGLAFALLREGSPRPAGPAPAPDASGPAAEASPAPGSSVNPGGVGFVGLPPEGATPSTPKRGEAVLRLGSGTLTPGGLAVWVFADGRVIWVRNHGVPLLWRPYAANGSTTGLLERRLTREGVELLRSAIMRTPKGDHVFRLDELLLDPLSWLPASAWEDLEIRAYVPSRFAVCPGVRNDPSEEFRNPRLTRLPEQAADLLRASNWLPRFKCYDVTTEDARAIVKSLEADGFERFEEGSAAQALGYVAISGGTEFSVDFNPMLPSGEVVWLQFG